MVREVLNKSAHKEIHQGFVVRWLVFATCLLMFQIMKSPWLMM